MARPNRVAANTTHGPAPRRFRGARRRRRRPRTQFGERRAAARDAEVNETSALAASRIGTSRFRGVTLSAYPRRRKKRVKAGRRAVRDVDCGYALRVSRPHAAVPDSPPPDIPPADRLDAIRRAQVWTPAEVAAFDFTAGEGEFAPWATVTCDHAVKEYSGKTPKFGCTVAPGDIAKIKFGDDNNEVYAGVAATRLLRALGFGVDTLYPVRVECRGCPASLGGAPGGPNLSVFAVAALERKMKAKEVTTGGKDGWVWSELDLDRSVRRRRAARAARRAEAPGRVPPALRQQDRAAAPGVPGRAGNPRGSDVRARDLRPGDHGAGRHHRAGRAGRS